MGDDGVRRCLIVRVSVWEDGKDLEMDGGDICTI